MARKEWILALAFAFAGTSIAHAQSRAQPKPQTPSAYWVFFKASSTHSNAAPALSAATLAQRSKDGIAITNEDRPLPHRLLNEIRATGAHVRTESRWLRAVSVQADAAALKRIAKLNDVDAIEPVALLSTLSAGEAVQVSEWSLLTDRVGEQNCKHISGGRDTDDLRQRQAAGHHVDDRAARDGPG